MVKCCFSRIIDDCSNLRNFHIGSVLVHSGGVHGGHYYAFIRPTLSDQWYASDPSLFFGCASMCFFCIY